MKKLLFRLLCVLLAAALLMPCIPEGEAAEVPSLSGLIRSGERRRFVSAMLNFHLTENTVVQKTLEEGYSAVFLFDGCSDNMDDPRLSDLSYYRVSGVCIVIRLDEAGKPTIIYFNDDCSTLPDRPLDVTQWELEGIGPVGPATVCDGTYELYSVYHAGAYEALHMRTSYDDATVAAVYMNDEQAVPSRATYINIHTRTGNHILQKASWSAGCMLVGDGDFTAFEALLDAAYDPIYPEFAVDRKVGTVTVNRLPLRSALIRLYENEEAVDEILTASRCDAPAIYLERCGKKQPLEPVILMEAVADTALMSLPCATETDSRSVPGGKLARGATVDICGQIRNTEGEIWYEVSLMGGNLYVCSEDVQVAPEKPETSRLRRFFSWIFGR